MVLMSFSPKKQGGCQLGEKINVYVVSFKLNIVIVQVQNGVTVNDVKCC